MNFLTHVLRDSGFSSDEEAALCDLLLLTLKLEKLPEFENRKDALNWLVDITQKHWLRGEGLERWEVTDSPDLIRERARIDENFAKIGMLDAIKPSAEYYDYVLLMGALQSRVETRLNYAVTCYEEKSFQFGELVILGGARPLMDDKEAFAAKLSEGDKTEYHMMLTVLRALASERNTNSDFFEKPLTALNTPMQESATGVRRPNTNDTVETWLKTKPKPGRVLVVSNQPYCVYQDAVVKSLLPRDFTIDTIGHQASGNDGLRVHLDTLARVFYTKKPELTKKYGLDTAPASEKASQSAHSVWKQRTASAVDAKIDKTPKPAI